MVLSAEGRDGEVGERLKGAALYLGAVDPLHRRNDVHGAIHSASRQSHFAGFAGENCSKSDGLGVVNTYPRVRVLLLRVRPTMTAQMLARIASMGIVTGGNSCDDGARPPPSPQPTAAAACSSSRNARGVTPEIARNSAMRWA